MLPSENTLREHRYQESLASNLSPLNSQEAPLSFDLIMTSSSDEGVARNMGRCGARFAPEVLINQLKKTVKEEQSLSIKTLEVFPTTGSFEEKQKKSQEKIAQALGHRPNQIIHLGGGHDHIYPLLKALDQEHKTIHVLNIDAHLDTRQDKHPHSGTPFRQFINEAKSNFKLFQTGIHLSANSLSTRANLLQQVSIQTLEALKKESENFSQVKGELLEFIQQDCDYFILSLDADALDASIMEAVSAVNGRGIPLEYVHEIIKELKGKKSILGLYEYNPLFDNLSNKGARALVSIIKKSLSEN